jgi:ferric-dicitrate binding protein FerR (iron transport regulator)
MDQNKLIDYIEGRLSPTEQEEIKQWLATDEKHQKQLDHLFYTLTLHEKHQIMSQIDTEKRLNELHARMFTKKEEKKTHRMVWKKKLSIAVAAFFTGVLLMAGYIEFFTSSQEYSIQTLANNKAQVMLPDGTQVWLNENSSLNYHKEKWSSLRTTHLVGEAYFEVYKDKHAPFEVISKNVKTTVLGTKFNIKAYPENDFITTTLLEGSINLSFTDGAKEQLKLLPNQEVITHTQHHRMELKDCSIEKGSIFWIKNKFQFNDTKLIDIATHLEQYYHVHIHFLNEEMKKEQFTGEFNRNMPIEKIFSLLSLTKHFVYQIDGDTIILQ